MGSYYCYCYCYYNNNDDDNGDDFTPLPLRQWSGADGTLTTLESSRRPALDFELNQDTNPDSSILPPPHNKITPNSSTTSTLASPLDRRTQTIPKSHTIT